MLLDITQNIKKPGIPVGIGREGDEPLVLKYPETQANEQEQGGH